MSKKDLLALRTALCASGVGSSGVAGATLDKCFNCADSSCYLGCASCTSCPRSAAR